GLFRRRDIAAVAVRRVGGPAVVELVDELGFVQWQSISGCIVLEKVAVVRHVEHGHERNAPRVLRGFHHFGLLALAYGNGIAHQHRSCAVELLGQFRIALAAKYRAGERVGIDEAEFVGREGEAAARVMYLNRLASKEHEARAVSLSQRDHAELKGMVNGRKDKLLILKRTKFRQSFVLG